MNTDHLTVLCDLLLNIPRLGGDQGLLNTHFSEWATADAAHRIPFAYNVTFTASYGYAPALRHFRGDVRIVHFIGAATKPWMYHRSADGRVIPRGGDTAMAAARAHLEFVELWWAVHDRAVKPVLARSDAAVPAFAAHYNSWVC